MNEFGANRQAEDNHRNTALHFAAFFGHENTVLLLVKTLQVQKDAKDQNGKTALDVAQKM